MNSFGKGFLAVVGFLSLILCAISSFAKGPDVDMTLNGAEIKNDGVVVQQNGQFTPDLKDTQSDEIGLGLAPSSCASGESMLTYFMRPASNQKKTNTQKIMHRVTQDRKLFAQFNDDISISFDAVFPDINKLPAPVKKGVIFLQIWQGAPYPPPLALSIVGGDAKKVEVDLNINVPDQVRSRDVLARLTLPREECIKFTIGARPTLPGARNGYISLQVEANSASGRESLFEKSWDANFGFDPINPNNLFPKRCQKRAAKCCSQDGICHPNRQFNVLFGLYRPSQDVPAQISIGDVKYSLTP